MSLVQDIAAAQGDPRHLEELYQQAQQRGESAQFAAEIERLSTSSPDDVLLAAWRYRLQPAPATAAGRTQDRRILWQAAIPLGLLLSIAYWFFLKEEMTLANKIPYFLYVWAPVAAVALIAFLVLGAGGRASVPRAVAAGAVALALAAYAMWLSPNERVDYGLLSILHLPILAWAAVGVCVAGPGANNDERFAFLIKSAEAVVTGGLYGGAAMLFIGVSTALFEAIGIEIFSYDELMRVIGSLVLGLIPVLAVATVYDPAFAPLEQRFEEGLSKLIATLGRFFLPPTVMVAVIYVLSIPFNFWRPFEERDVLISYNVMLFAVMALLVFATPVVLQGLSTALATWLRRGILTVAALAVLVSVYAMSATVYRTWQGGLTINRTMIIGWNLINIGILIHLLYTQRRAGQEDWLARIQRTARLGMIGYVAWSIALVVAIPWLFAQ